jgi:hypothetical protein
MPFADARPEEQGGAPTTAADRRLCVRHVADVETVCQPVASWTTEQLKWQARIRDVSCTGIALVLSRRFERGTGLAIEVPGSEPDSSHTIFARIARVIEEPDGSWLVGCAFVSELSDEELRALIRAVPAQEDVLPGASVPVAAPAVDTPPPVRSTGVDGAGTTTVEYVRLRCLLDGGRTVRRRVRRLHLTGPWPLRPGSTVRGWAGKGTPRGRKLTLRVRGCRRDDRGWVVTCQLAGVSVEDACRWLELAN